MSIKWSEWNRFGIFVLVLALLIFGITFWSLGAIQERVTLQTSYALSPNNWCHVLSPEDTASYVSERLAEMTGESVSPLLSLTIIGGFRNICTEDQYKELLPWYYQFNFLGGVFVILLVLTLKDTFLTFLGPAKKPLDALGELVHVVSGAVVLPIGVTSFADSISIPIAEQLTAFSSWIIPSAYAIDATTSIDISGPFLFLGQFFGVGAGFIIFSATWILGNVIDILIFASPIPFFDAILSGIRSSLIGLIMLLAYFNPLLGGLLALIIILVSTLSLGWSFRFLTFGIIYCVDVLFRKWRNFEISEQGVLTFSGKGVPMTKSRVLGHLYPENEKSIIFAYYPYLIFPRKKVIVPINFNNSVEVVLIRGLIAPKIIKYDFKSDKSSTLFRFTPRCRRNEDFVAQHLEVDFNMNVNTNKKFGFFGWLSSIF